jgi:hypothetical protein
VHKDEKFGNEIAASLCSDCDIDNHAVSDKVVGSTNKRQSAHDKNAHQTHIEQDD